MLILFLAAFSSSHTGGYYLSQPVWAGAFVVALAAVALMADRSPTYNLLVSWAVIGTVAIYFPALFQRKLTMGLAIPWGLLAGHSLCGYLLPKERSARNLVTALGLIILGGSAVRWAFREMEYVKMGVGSTARHPVYLKPDIQKIVEALSGEKGRRVVVTWPGAPTPAVDEQGNVIPDLFEVPQIPDIAPFLSGLAGVYTYAGHWSETPDYNRRAGESTRFLLGTPVGNAMPMGDEERQALMEKWGINYAVVPKHGTEMVAPDSLGTVIVTGAEFDLVRLGRP